MSKPARRQDWATPDWLFDLLDGEFHFGLDAAAEEWNAKCDLYLTDALNGESWPGGNSAVWLNPPYAYELVTKFLDRARYESDRRTVVVLLPVRSEMDWWHAYVHEASELRFIRGRVAFVPPPDHNVSPAGNRPVYNSVVAIFRTDKSSDLVKVESINAPRNRKQLTKKEAPPLPFVEDP